MDDLKKSITTGLPVSEDSRKVLKKVLNRNSNLGSVLKNNMPVKQNPNFATGTHTVDADNDYLSYSGVSNSSPIHQRKNYGPTHPEFHQLDNLRDNRKLKIDISPTKSHY